MKESIDPAKAEKNAIRRLNELAKGLQKYKPTVDKWRAEVLKLFEKDCPYPISNGF